MTPAAKFCYCISIHYFVIACLLEPDKGHMHVELCLACLLDNHITSPVPEGSYLGIGDAQWSQYQIQSSSSQ